MKLDAARIDRPGDDPVSDVLKWVLLVVAIGTFALLAWATTVTYQTAPPQPDRFVAANGTVLMTGDDIAAGKGGFQKADLMDYGSLYGMGSYYGEDYTASALVRPGTATQNNMAMASFGKSLEALSFERQASPETGIGLLKRNWLGTASRSAFPVSDCELIDTYSPAAIDIASVTSPTGPASKDAYGNSGDTFRHGSQAIAKKAQDNPLGFGGAARKTLHVGPDDEAGRQLASRAAHASSLARQALRR
jgi:hypothetical protein